MNKLIILIAVIIIAGIGWFVWEKPQVSAPSTQAASPLNATYIIDGNRITFVNGESEIEISFDSATKITTSIFGDPVYGDLNKDGKNEAAVFIAQNPGGSGTFYYAAAALNENGGYVGTNAIHLGDRIAPQNINLISETRPSDSHYGMIVVNYADRKPGEPMTAQPSVGVSKYLTIENGKLVENQQAQQPMK
ncbi:MAG: hypothetical protein Q7R98_02545 [Candidatus Jorgensenbacteria bacterium]|nr:hypothetical protein [Candidatus Jorgensenbacteria bacterium]